MASLRHIWIASITALVFCVHYKQRLPEHRHCNTTTVDLSNKVATKWLNEGMQGTKGWFTSRMGQSRTVQRFHHATQNSTQFKTYALPPNQETRAQYIDLRVGRNVSYHQVRGAQTWLHITITWVSFKKFTKPQIHLQIYRLKIFWILCCRLGSCREQWRGYDLLT